MTSNDPKSVKKKRGGLISGLYQAGFKSVDIPEGCTAKIELSRPKGRQSLDPLLEVPIPKEPDDRLRLLKMLLKGDDIPRLKRALALVTDMPRNWLPDEDEFIEAVIDACLRNLLIDDNLLLDGIYRALLLFTRDEVRSRLTSRLEKEVAALLGNTSPTARSLGTWLLFVVDPNPPLSKLEPLAEDPHTFVRRCVAEGLSRVKDQTRISLLCKLLSDDDDGVRLAAIASLRWTKVTLSIDAVERLVREPDKDIRLAAMNLFESVPPSKKVFDMLVEFMHDPDPEIREEAIHTFQSSLSTEEARVIQKEVADLMEQSGEDIVKACAKVLMWVGDAEHIQLLAKTYEKFPLDTVKHAVWVLSGSFEKMEGAQRTVPYWGKGYFSPMIERAKEICIKRGRTDFTLDEHPGTTKKVSQIEVVSGNEKVFIFKKHPLDAWLVNLTEVRYKDLQAFVVRGWPFEDSEYAGNPANWTPTHIRLARMVFRQDTKKVSELFEYISGSDFHEDGAWSEDYINSLYKGEEAYKQAIAWREAWMSPLKFLVKGAENQLVEPSLLFSIEFYIEGAMSLWYWGWNATAFTEDLAVISQWETPDLDGLHVTPWIPIPLGIVMRKDIFRSTALLFRNCKTLESHDDRFGGEYDGANFWHSVKLKGIDVPSLYRILMAHQGRGGNKILDMDAQSLIDFKEEDMTHGYADLLEVVREQ